MKLASVIDGPHNNPCFQYCINVNRSRDSLCREIKNWICDPCSQEEEVQQQRR